MNPSRSEFNSETSKGVVRTLAGDSSQVQETVSLLETAVINIKRYGSELVSLRNENKKVCDELAGTKKECLLLKEEVQRLKSASCENCAQLMRKISDQRREIIDTKKRIQSIASILNIGNDGQSIKDPETQNALLLMTEMLEKPAAETNKSPNRRKINKNVLPSFSSSTKSVLSPVSDEIIVPESMTIGDDENKVRISPRRILVIPETQDISPKRCRTSDSGEYETSGKPLSENQPQRTPKKDESKKRMEDQSPILDRSAKRKKGLSVRSQNEVKKSSLLPQNDVSLSLLSVSDSRTNKQKSPTNVLDVMAPGPSSRKNVSPRKSKSPNKEKPNSKWSLKPCRNLDDDLTSKTDKKFKQTKLSLKPVEIKKDITKLRNFNGGVHSGSLDSVVVIDDAHDVMSDDEIVLSSPCDKKLKKNNYMESASGASRQKIEMNAVPRLELDSMDVTMFNPLATSTCKLDSSFDKIPGRDRKSPPFKYQRDAVRKKSERMQLEGWDCDHCAKYYQAVGKNLKPHEIKAIMNRCSRHRNKYPVRTNTPPGFWDPVFPSSESEDENVDKAKKKR